MTLSKIKLWHFILFVWAVILIIRIDLLISTAELFWYTILLLFNDFDFLYLHLSLQLIDSLFAFVFVLTMPLIILLSKRRNKILNSNITFSQSFIVLLLFCFFVPALVTREHPDYQKNISEVKLLPPLSIIYKIVLKEDNHSIENSDKEKFLRLKEKVILKEFNQNTLYVKSYSLKDSHSLLNKDNFFVSINSDSVLSINSEIIYLGTDEFARDIFSRLIFGARISVFIGIMAVIISLILGLILGYFASTGNQFISFGLNRLADLFLSFPSIFLVILILALFGNNLISVIVVLGFSGWMSLYKIVSAEVASVKQKDFFITSKKIGLTNFELLVKEIIPVIIIPVTVNLVFQLSNVILAESALSFLGLGAGINYPSWGSMIEKGQEYITNAWWMIFIPGIVLVLTLLSFHNIAKEVNKFFNPKIN